MKVNIFNSFVWKFLERVGIQIVNFIITLVLARILGASDYGMVALLSVFITFATVFVQEGFNIALIRQKEIDNDEYTSTFYFSILISLLLYAILYLIAPLISKFYNMENLILMIRILSIVLFPAALNSVQVAYFTKKFEFKKMFLCNLSAMTISGIISITFAISGGKAWSLVINQLAYQCLSCLLMWFVGKWRPNGKFVWNKLKKIIGFGNKMLFSSLLVNLFLNIRSLLIGKFYNSAELGYFNRGKSFSATLMEGVNGSLQTVLLPTYSNVQDKIYEVKNLVRKSIGISCYIIFPMLIGLLCVSEPLIYVLLGEGWIQAIPFVQIFALSYIFQPTQIASAQAIKALGYGNEILKIEFARKFFEILFLVFALFRGTTYIAISAVLAGFVSVLITIYPNKKILGYKIGEQIKDFMNPLIQSIIMGIVILISNNIFEINKLLLLIIDVILGIVIYLIISIVTKNEYFKYLILKIKNILIK